MYQSFVIMCIITRNNINQQYNQYHTRPVPSEQIDEGRGEKIQILEHHSPSLEPNLHQSRKRPLDSFSYPISKKSKKGGKKRKSSKNRF